MAQGMACTWAEDDFDTPGGAVRLDDSKPGDNKDYIMYHGTTKKNADKIRSAGFKQSEDGMLGRGVYLSRDLEKASRYPINHPEHDRVVIKVTVNVGKVIVINQQDHPRQKNWHDGRHGPVYDTAWVPPECGMVRSGLEEDCVWDPKRIKIIQVIKPTTSGRVKSGLQEEEDRVPKRNGIGFMDVLQGPRHCSHDLNYPPFPVNQMIYPPICHRCQRCEICGRYYWM